MHHTLRFKVLTGFWLFLVFVLAVFSFPHYLFRGPGCDFSLRVTEVEVVRQGTDPYDIFSGKLKSDVYYPLCRDEFRTETRNRPIHAYPPWSYTYFMPFATPGSLGTKWFVWAGVEGVCFVLMIAFALFCGWRLRRDKWDAAFVLAASLSLGVTLGPNFGNGNYTYVMTVLLPLLAWLLFKRHDILAGVCWALLMVKPQEGALLALPILLARRWKTLVVAVAVCLVAGTVAAFQIHKNLFDLILQIPVQGAPFYSGSVLLPISILHGLERLGLQRGMLLAGNMAVGILLCGYFTYCVRNSKDWRIKVMPSIVFASAWTYMNFGDRQLFFLAQILFAESVLLHSGARYQWIGWFGIVSIFFSGMAILVTCTDLFATLAGMLSLPHLFEWVCAVVPPVQTAADICVLLACAAFCLNYRRESVVAESV